MGTVNLGQLRLAAKRKADMENSTFISDAEWNDVINREAAALYLEFIEAYEDHFLTYVPFTLTSASNAFPLPDDFLKLRGVDWQDGSLPGGWRPLTQFNFRRRNDFTPDIARFWRGGPVRRYRVERNVLWLTPETDASGNYRLWYITNYQPMVSDTDSIMDWVGVQELVILGAAIYALDKEESPTEALKRDKEQLRERIAEMAQNRNAGEPETVANVQDDDDWPYSSGSRY